MGLIIFRDEVSAGHLRYLPQSIQKSVRVNRLLGCAYMDQDLDGVPDLGFIHDRGVPLNNPHSLQVSLAVADRRGGPSRLAAPPRRYRKLSNAFGIQRYKWDFGAATTDTGISLIWGKESVV